MTKKKTLTGTIISGLIVVILAAAMVYGANAAMEAYMDYDIQLVQASAARAEQLRQAAEKGQSESLRAEAERVKHEQMETFYQQNKKRDNFHYYGQFYELFNNVYNADTIFIGTSHAAHGINPLYLEESMPDRSFFNFALNGSVPSYYLKWYDIMKNEAGYPTPKTVIWCVDWFMCDTNWLWRRISFDEPADMPLGMMRAIRKTEKKPENNVAEDQTSPEKTESPAQQTDLTLLEKIKSAQPKSVDDVMTVIMQNIPVFSSRDRMPEMFRWLFGEKEQIPPPLTEEELEEIAQGYAEEVEIPVYEHEYLQDSQKNLTHLYYKGYIPWDVKYPGETTVVGCGFSDSEWDAFISLLDEFKKDGVEVIFVQVPEYSGAKSSDRKKYNHKIEKVAEEYGIPFLNYNDDLSSEINADPACYSDWGHMSLEGSTKFSEVLGEDLAALFSVEEPQNQPE